MGGFNPVKAVKKVAKDTFNTVTDPGKLLKTAVKTTVDPLGIGEKVIGEVGKALSPKIPEIDMTVPAPPPPSFAPEAATPEFGGGSGDSQKSRKKGRQALRIDLRTGNATAGSTGLNIPRS